MRAAISAVLAASLIALTLAPALAGGDAAAGKRKAVPCQPCHGVDGLSKLPIAPNLAGQPVDYLVKALGDFKSGTRTNEMMSLVVPNLSDQDIADLAAWYSSIKVSVSMPE